MTLFKEVELMYKHFFLEARRKDMHKEETHCNKKKTDIPTELAPREINNAINEINTIII